jgi:hypothetical protein
MGLSTFPVGSHVCLYLLDKPVLSFVGESYFGGVRRLWQLIMRMRPKDSMKKSEERIEESGGNVRGSWLNHDREEQMAIEELKGLSVSGLFGRPQKQRRTRGRSFVQSRWSSKESLVRVFFSV